MDIIQREDIKAFTSPTLGKPMDIAYCGGFESWHGIPVLVSAVRKAVDQGCDLHVTLIGSGTEKNNIYDLIKELGDLTIKVGWWQNEHPAASAETMEWVWFVVLKTLGLGLTAAAVSQGSSFWYDLLKKITAPATSTSSSKSSDGASSSSASSTSG